MLGGDHQVTKKLISTNLLFNCQNDLNRIGSVGPQVLLALKKNLLSALCLGVVIFFTQSAASTQSHFTFRLGKWLESLVAQLVRELTDLVQHTFTCIIFTVPLGDIIVWLFVLQPFQNLLIFNCNFHQLTFTLFTVKTFLDSRKVLLRVYSLITCVLVEVGGLDYTLGKLLAHIGSSGFLKNTGHFFKENSIFKFDFSVALYKTFSWMSYPEASRSALVQ